MNPAKCVVSVDGWTGDQFEGFAKVVYHVSMSQVMWTKCLCMLVLSVATPRLWLEEK